jgi:hypothetical protein
MNETAKTNGRTRRGTTGAMRVYLAKRKAKGAFNGRMISIGATFYVLAVLLPHFWNWKGNGMGVDQMDSRHVKGEALEAVRKQVKTGHISCSR